MRESDTTSQQRSTSLLSLTVAELLDTVAADTPTPGGGAVAAVVTALAAALTGMAARYGPSSTDGAFDVIAMVRRAEQLRAAATPLGDADTATYRKVIEACRMPHRPDPEPRRRAVRDALSAATDVPLQIIEIAHKVTELAARIAQHGSRSMRGDATAAVLLASAAANTAAVLVEHNLAGEPDDPRVATTTTLAAEASTVASAVLTSVNRGRTGMR